MASVLPVGASCRSQRSAEEGSYAYNGKSDLPGPTPRQALAACSQELWGQSRSNRETYSLSDPATYMLARRHLVPATSRGRDYDALVWDAADNGCQHRRMQLLRVDSVKGHPQLQL